MEIFKLISHGEEASVVFQLFYKLESIRSIHNKVFSENSSEN